MVENIIVGGAAVAIGVLLLYISHGIWLLLKYGQPKWEYTRTGETSRKTFAKDNDPQPRHRDAVLTLLIMLTSFILAVLLVVFLWAIGEAVTSAVSLLN